MLDRSQNQRGRSTVGLRRPHKLFTAKTAQHCKSRTRAFQGAARENRQPKSAYAREAKRRQPLGHRIQSRFGWRAREATRLSHRRKDASEDEQGASVSRCQMATVILRKLASGVSILWREGADTPPTRGQHEASRYPGSRETETVLARVMRVGGCLRYSKHRRWERERKRALCRALMKGEDSVLPHARIESPHSGLPPPPFLPMAWEVCLALLAGGV